MATAKEIINSFIKEEHNTKEVKEALFKAAEAAKSEGWTFMETSFQLGAKAKEEGLTSEETESVIRRAFSSEKRTKEREQEEKQTPQNPGVPVSNVPQGQASVFIDPRFAMMGLDTQSIELLQNHRIDPEALRIPWPSADWRKDLAKLLEAVFNPDEIIAFKMSNTNDVTEERVDVITSQTDAIRKVMKSLDGKEGALLCINAIASENAKDESFKYRYVVVDNPHMSLAKQLAYYKALNLPCAALVNTGANSVQAWVKIGATTEEEYYTRVDFLFKTLEEQGFEVDEANKKASFMVRMPGVLRNGKQQYLIALEQGAKTFTEWQEWVEYSLDGKPLIELANDLEEAPKQEEDIVENVLRAGDFMVLSAAPKTGKSFALLDLALSVCYGESWFGFNTKMQDVLYVNFDLTRNAFLNRLFNLAAKKNVSPSSPHFGFLNLRGSTMSPLEIAEFIAKRVRGSQKLENHNYKAIIFDPIEAVLHSPKVLRTSTDVSRILMQMIDSIISLTGASVITAVNTKEIPYLETRADSLITLDAVEGIPNVYQFQGTFRNFKQSFTKECSFVYPQFIV